MMRDPGKPWLPNATVAWYQPAQCRLEVSAKCDAENYSGAVRKSNSGDRYRQSWVPNGESDMTDDRCEWGLGPIN